MRVSATAIALIAAAGLALPVAAQTTPAPPAIARAIVAATKLPSVVETPLYFKALRVTLQPGGTTSLKAANGILYQLSGATEVELGGEKKVLVAGEALFVAAGKTVSLSTGIAAPASLLYFLLASPAELGSPAAAAPGAVTELYRTAAPIPGLKPGGYDLNLTRVTFPAAMPSNPPHHRSGAALYYIVSGTGANTAGGKTEPRAPGSLIYEPSDLVHQWGNPGGEPLTFLAFNVNPDGIAAVLPEAPAKAP